MPKRKCYTPSPPSARDATEKLTAERSVGGAPRVTGVTGRRRLAPVARGSLPPSRFLLSPAPIRVLPAVQVVSRSPHGAAATPAARRQSQQHEDAHYGESCSHGDPRGCCSGVPNTDTGPNFGRFCA